MYIVIIIEFLIILTAELYIHTALFVTLICLWMRYVFIICMDNLSNP